MGTFFETVEDARKQQKWILIDADNKVIGRLASEVASILRGKRNPHYTAHIDTGDFVVVINADKAVFTRNKTQTKVYFKHTGFIGGIKEVTAGELLAKNPEEAIEHAVRGMLPKSALGHRQIMKLKIYKGAEHPHQAQNPVPFDIKQSYKKAAH